MKHAIRALACAAALGLAACGTTHDGVTSSSLSSGSPEGVAAPASDSLAGSSWRLVTLDGRAPVAGTTVTATFLDQDRLAGSAGCNRYMGGAVAKDGRIEVGLLATTMMHCGDVLMPQERAYLELLGGARAYEVRGGELRLLSSEGRATLVFGRE